MQSGGEDGCLWGCGAMLVLIPVGMIAGIIDNWNKNKADRLEAKNRVLRLEAERERLKDRNAAKGLEEENRVLRLEAERARLKSEREDALAARKRRKMEKAGYVLCPSCNVWRTELNEDGICEPCDIEDEIESAIT